MVVDATFREEKKRRDFLELASRLGVPAALMVCQTDPEIVRLRLGARRGDVSDADWSVYLRAVEQWEEPGPETRQALHIIRTDGTAHEAVAETIKAINELNLFE
jgi:predicted kinase